MKLKISISFFVKAAFISLAIFFNLKLLHGQSSKTMNAKFSSNSGFSFVENRGQIKDKAGNRIPDVLFVGSKGNSKVFLRKTGISYVFSEFPHIILHKYQLAGIKSQTDIPGKVYKGYRLDVDFVNCNPDSKMITENQGTSYTNYYLPSCPDGLLNVRSYQRITYEDIYPHIDLVFYSNDNGLEYDFRVKKGGNPNDIKLRYNGAEKLSLSEGGELNISFPLGQITENAPKVYDENLRPLKSSFRINSNNETVSFRVDGYHHQAITIDPSVQWSTYIGGSGNDYLTVLAIDKDSNVYGVGGTQSADFPVTAGAFQQIEADTGNIPQGDVVIFKFTSAGKLLWCTYFGGSSEDYNLGSQGESNGPGIVVDTSGNIVIAGGTRSTDLPVTTNAFQQKFTGQGIAAFIAKFNPSGQRIWASFFGDATSYSIAASVAVDKANNIYIAGETSAQALPGYRKNYVIAGNFWDHIFVAKFSSSCRLIWSILYGGSQPDNVHVPSIDYATDINVDDSCNIVIEGNITSANFPLHNAFDSGRTLLTDMMGMGFVMKFDSAGNRKWATLVGGVTTMVDLVVDKEGNTYSTGYSQPGGTMKEIENGYQNVAGVVNAILIKYDPNGQVIWGTYFNGSDLSEGFGVTVDANENVTMTGIMRSTDMPVKDPIQMKAGGGGSGNIDGFVAKFNKSGGLVWSTYYGGDKNDNPTDIEQDQHGNLYFCGLTQGDYPIKNAYQNSFGGGSDGFITKILDCTGLYSKVKILAKNFCFGDTVILSADGGYNTYRWSNGDSTQSIKVTKSGVYSAIISSSGGCSGSTQAITLKFTNPPASSIQPSGPLTFCKGDSVGLAATGVYPKYLWSNGDTTYKIIAKNAGKYVLTTYNASGCSVSDSVNVSYLKSPSPLITGSNNFSLCPAGSVVLDAGKGYKKYVWNTGDTTEKITVTKIDSFQVTVDSATLTCKGISPWVHTRNVNINIVSNNSATTCGDSVVLDAGYGFSSYLWNTGETTQIITVGKSGNYKVIVKTSSGCTDTSKPFKVIIYPAPVKPEIVQNGDTLSTKQGQKYGYQWSENGQPIAGETKYKLTPIGEGTYSVETTDSNGCQISSDPYVIGSGYFKVFPNPTTSILFVESETSGPVDYKYEMFDMLGRELINDDDGLHSGIYKKQISLETFAGAMYILRVKVGTVVYTNKIVKSQRY